MSIPLVLFYWRSLFFFNKITLIRHSSRIESDPQYKEDLGSHCFPKNNSRDITRKSSHHNTLKLLLRASLARQWATKFVSRGVWMNRLDRNPSFSLSMLSIKWPTFKRYEGAILYQIVVDRFEHLPQPKGNFGNDSNKKGRDNSSNNDSKARVLFHGNWKELGLKNAREDGDQNETKAIFHGTLIHWRRGQTKEGENLGHNIWCSNSQYILHGCIYRQINWIYGIKSCN